MVNGTIHFQARAGNFLFEQGHTRFQFGNGKGIKVLLEDQGERVIRLAGQIFFHIHGRNVDRAIQSVNKGVAILMNNVRCCMGLSEK